MALDTNIALGVKPVEQVNMLGQMGQMMQLRQANDEYQSNNALKDFYAQGGDLSRPEDQRRLMSTVGAKGADLIAKQAALEKTKAEVKQLGYKNVESAFAQSREALTSIDPSSPNAGAQLMAWHEANHKDPVMGSVLATSGIDAASSRAALQAAIAKGPAAIQEAIRRSSMGQAKYQAELMQTERSVKVAGIGAGATMRGQDMTDKRLREQFQYNIDNPAMQPLAGEKIDADGNKVPAYFGYNSRTNSMVEVAMPNVSVGPSTPIAAPTNGIAPPNVNALTMPPAGAPTSPVVRPATATMPFAAAPSAVMPSAASPMSVVPGAPNAPAPVRFGPKSTAENLTEAQGKATGFALRAKQASDILDIVGKDGKVQPGALKRVGESVPLVGEGLGTMLNFTQTAPQQQVEQAQRAFVNAILRQESGAAINESEFVNAKKQYFPQPGDSREVIEQKRLNRETAVKSLEVAAGPGMKQAAPATGIKIGTVEEGYKFKGGDPANKNNWVKQ
jgi:hypothetical protein